MATAGPPNPNHAIRRCTIDESCLSLQSCILELRKNLEFVAGRNRLTSKHPEWQQRDTSCMVRGYPPSSTQQAIGQRMHTKDEGKHCCREKKGGNGTVKGKQVEERKGDAIPYRYGEGRKKTIRSERRDTQIRYTICVNQIIQKANSKVAKPLGCPR